MQIRDRIKELRRVPANSLVVNEANWRNHPEDQRRAFRSLLDEIGFAGALMVRELPDGRLQLLDGQMRTEEVSDAVVPVLVTDLSDDEADKLLATYDSLGAMAQTDTAKLTALLAQCAPEDEEFAAHLERLAGANSWSGTEETGADGRYPIVPRFAESYGYVIIFTTTEIDYLNLQEMLELGKARCRFNPSRVGLGRVVKFEDFRKIFERKAGGS